MGTLPTLRAAFDEKATGGEFFGPNGFMELWGNPIEVEPNKLSEMKRLLKNYGKFRKT